jgi:hypothetical protein
MKDTRNLREAVSRWSSFSVPRYRWEDNIKRDIR